MKALKRLEKAFEWAIEGLYEGRGSFQHGNVSVSYNLNERGIEVEVYNKSKDRYLENIASWLEDLFVPCESVYDVWDDHGFRDESDYYRWRYGA